MCSSLGISMTFPSCYFWGETDFLVESVQNYTRKPRRPDEF